MNKVLAQDQDPISTAAAEKPRSAAVKPVPDDALILVPLRNNVLFPGVISPVTVGRHVIVGNGSVLLPGVTLGEGAAVGALSIVKRDVPPFAIVAGPDGRQIGERRRDLLELERRVGH